MQITIYDWSIRNTISIRVHYAVGLAPCRTGPEDPSDWRGSPGPGAVSHPPKEARPCPACLSTPRARAQGTDHEGVTQSAAEELLC
jgi:hypothetical protein